MARDIAREIVTILESSYKNEVFVIHSIAFSHMKNASEYWLKHKVFPEEDNAWWEVIRCLDNNFIEIEFTPTHESDTNSRRKLWFDDVPSAVTFLMNLRSNFHRVNACILHPKVGFIQSMYDENDHNNIRDTDKLTKFLSMAFKIRIPSSLMNDKKMDESHRQSGPSDR